MDIFLYPGQQSPSDVRLSDPTVPIPTGTQYTYMAAGGVTCGGTALVIHGKFPLSMGGLTAGSAGLVRKGKILIGSGGLTALGTASIRKGKVLTSIGGMNLGGAAMVIKGKAARAGGGVTLGGVADVKHGSARIGSGGIVSSGVADTFHGSSRPSSGLSVFCGVASVCKGKSYVMSGVALGFGGAAVVEVGLQESQTVEQVPQISNRVVHDVWVPLPRMVSKRNRLLWRSRGYLPQTDSVWHHKWGGTAGFETNALILDDVQAAALRATKDFQFEDEITDEDIFMLVEALD